MSLADPKPTIEVATNGKVYLTLGPNDAPEVLAEGDIIRVRNYRYPHHECDGMPALYQDHLPLVYLFVGNGKLHYREVFSEKIVSVALNDVEVSLLAKGRGL